MSCNKLEAIVKSCDNNIGGIYKAYIFDMDDINTITEDPNTWTITALTLLGHNPAQSFDFKRNTSDFTDAGAADLINGSTFYTKTLNLKFHRRDADKSKAIKILAEGQRYLGAVVLDANGTFWYLDYLQLKTVGGGSGKLKGDGSNYDVVLVGENEFAAKTVSSTIANLLLIAVS